MVFVKIKSNLTLSANEFTFSVTTASDLAPAVGACSHSCFVRVFLGGGKC
jgi:hypothetical protein